MGYLPFMQLMGVFLNGLTMMEALLQLQKLNRNANLNNT